MLTDLQWGNRIALDGLEERLIQHPGVVTTYED